MSMAEHTKTPRASESPSPGDTAVEERIRKLLLTPEQLFFDVDAGKVADLDDGGKVFDVIGQPRALKALEMAIQVNAKGYNVFATGMAGTGKRTAITKMLAAVVSQKRKLRDIAFVHNFARPDAPEVLYFPKGRGTEFQERMKRLTEHVAKEVRALFQNLTFRDTRDKLLVETEGQESRTLADFENRLRDDGFRIVQVEGDENQDPRSDIVPVVDGEAVDFQELQKHVSEGRLDPERWESMRERYYKHLDEMEHLYRDLRIKRNEVEESISDLRAKTLKPKVDEAIQDIRNDFDDPAISAYLDRVAADIAENSTVFLPDAPPKDELGNPPRRRYEVNVVLDHGETEGAPVIFERQPDYHRLVGRQDQTFDSHGEPHTSFVSIRAGSLIQASGGYLILRAEDILSDEDSWNALKRALQDGVVEIRNQPGPFNMQASGLNPAPVKVDVKVIIMGSENIYDVLYNTDEAFQKLFKVPAEFDSSMERTDEAVRRYIGFTRLITSDEGLKPLDHGGIAQIVRHGVRMSEFRSKLSTRFGIIADLIREADYWAGQMGKTVIDDQAVRRAQDERSHMHNLPEEKIDEEILSGELIISFQDNAVGRINGLAILDRGYYSFARPMVITARVSPGSDGIINIERESGLSGEIHDKGVYILEGFLQSTYARDFPISIRASVCFEQSYIEVDGDSASSTEIYVLLSAIAEIPLRQDVAVTGSVNQMGEIQAVGGVSEKIEGFYAICKQVGLTGSQGVIIPQKNIENVVLNREVERAVAEGMFHVYGVETVNEGLEILTGLEAGKRTQKGPFKSGTVNALVEKRLHEMARTMKEFGNS